MASGELLTVAEVAAYLNIKSSTIYAKVSQIPHYKIGHLIRFKKEDIDFWLERIKVPANDPQRKAKQIVRRAAAANRDIQRIVRKTIDRVKAREYNSDNGKTGPTQGLPQKGGHHGSL